MSTQTLPTSSSKEITVRVKHGSLKCGDLDIQCHINDSVEHLKQLICEKSPMHPDARDQRLIYAGHLLKDEQSLTDVFGLGIMNEETQTCFTVHLAYSRLLSSRFQQSLPSTPKTATTPLTETSHNQAGFPTGTQGQANFSASYAPLNLGNVQTGMSPDLIAMHEFYLSQMMTYMMQWSQLSYHVLQSAGVIDPTAAPPSPAFSPAPADPPANAVPNDDLGRGNDIRADDDEAPRDILDWVYTLIRVAFILSVVYFYSNVIRFALVVICTALVVIFQRRQVARQAAQQQVNNRQGNVENGPAPEQPGPRPTQPREPNNTENEGRETNASQNGEHSTSTGETNTDQGTTGTGNPNIMAAENTQPPEVVAANVARLSIRDITWTFFTTFFSSLIPEMPQNN